MKSVVYLRPLRADDAKISCKWRNDPEVWKFTGSRPDRYITYEIEKEWLNFTLEKKSERRFAICLKKGDRYIGNTQLLGIRRKSASFHLFIGDRRYWGKGIGKEASFLILQYAFSELKLQQVALEVHKENIPAISIYKSMGFEHVDENNNFLVMILKKARFSKLWLAADRTSAVIEPADDFQPA